MLLFSINHCLPPSPLAVGSSLQHSCARAIPVGSSKVGVACLRIAQACCFTGARRPSLRLVEEIVRLAPPSSYCFGPTKGSGLSNCDHIGRHRCDVTWDHSISKSTFGLCNNHPFLGLSLRAAFACFKLYSLIDWSSATLSDPTSLRCVHLQTLTRLARWQDREGLPGQFCATCRA